MLRYFSRKIKAHHLDAYAAQAAFFLLLSAVPLLMLVFGLFRLFPLPAEDFPKGWGGFFPGDTALLLEEALAKVPGKGDSLLASFSAVTVLWSASKSVYYLMGGLNSVF
ncbi:MAG: YihY/virulence factor BrkB family protein, partial [Clostridia bacterium]|nr:YihY/virulence factor BrkB family protein [Clostridia bacterium]